MIWNLEYESMSRPRLADLQSKRLQEIVAKVHAKVPYYRQKMEEAGIKPEDIRSLDDLVHLPFTTKEDLRENYPFGLFAAPMEEEIGRAHV